MAGWQDLYEMLLDEKLSAEEVVNRLGVKPSRLKQLLSSRRLAARMEMVRSVAERRSDQAVVAAAGAAARKLAALTACERPETARRACLDLLERAREIRKPEAIRKPFDLGPARRSRRDDGRRGETTRRGEGGNTAKRHSVPLDRATQRGGGDDTAKRHSVPLDRATRRGGGDDTAKRHCVPLDRATQRGGGDDTAKRHCAPLDRATRRGGGGDTAKRHFVPPDRATGGGVACPAAKEHVDVREIPRSFRKEANRLLESGVPAATVLKTAAKIRRRQEKRLAQRRAAGT